MIFKILHNTVCIPADQYLFTIISHMEKHKVETVPFFMLMLLFTLFSIYNWHMEQVT